MFTKQGIELLHKEMHRRIDDLLNQAELLDPAAFVGEMPGFGRASIRNQMVHMIATEQYWVNGVQGKSTARWDYDQFTDVAAIKSVKQRVMLETQEFLRQISETDLNKAVSPAPPQWLGPLRSPAFILCHVITHAFHHKGQIVAMFRLAGHPMGDTDLQRDEPVKL